MTMKRCCHASNRHAPRTLVSILLLVWCVVSSDAEKCFSCSGTCHSDVCNCQMGSCNAEACFSERRPTEVAGVWQITKGCVRRPSRTRVGCDYDQSSSRVLCVCSDGEFCNADPIVVRDQPLRRNITCRACAEREPDCGRTCLGHWCHEDAVTGASGCGHGPPALPFFYKGPELLYYRNKLCVTLSRGAGAPRRHCICSTHMCNAWQPSIVAAAAAAAARHRTSSQADGTHSVAALRSRSLIASNALPSSSSSSSSSPSSPSLSLVNNPTLPLFACVNCELATADLTGGGQAITAQCRHHRCFGHFCTIATQRLYGGRAGSNSVTGGAPVSSNGHLIVSIIEKQGCLNVTSADFIQLGCTHRWQDGSEEEVVCACRGHLCNSDHLTASARQRSLPGIVATVIVALAALLLMLPSQHRLI